MGVMPKMEHVVVGTAGHIDHGKTALVKALTGMDCDTLAEEKKRGITIELGFAFFEDPRFEKLVIFIDVPGHEKLIKTMVAGASNLDAALMVVAADEGVNVQTLEHFDILQLLDIDTGIIALTKCDLVDAERLSVVRAEVESLVAGTSWESAPIIPVSAFEGTGIPELRTALVEAANRVRPRTDSGLFRMPIDRVFTMQGFGVVIAGTILGGEAKVGDKLEILPDGLVSRVRGIQIHAKSIPRAGLGTRTAINLQDVKKEQLRRGQMACAPGAMKSTQRMDAQLRVLKSCPDELKNRTRVRLHVGTDEVMARLVLLDRDRLEQGATALVQFVLESPTAALAKDRYVIRTFSSMETIGGGVIVDAHPAQHRRFDAGAVDALERRLGGMAEAVEEAFRKSGVTPLSVAEAAMAVGESEDDVWQVVDGLRAEGTLARVFPRSDGEARDAKRETYVHGSVFADLTEKLLSAMREFYSNNPYRIYVPLADLQSRFAKLVGKPVYEALMGGLSDDGTLVVKRTRVALGDREIDWKPGESEIADRIERIYEEAAFAAPLEDEVMRKLGLPEAKFGSIMTALTEQGRLVRLGEKVTYHRKHLVAARKMVVDHISSKGSITAGELRDMLGLSRKYAISLLEYFDRAQLTRRLEDRRVLVRRA